MLTSCQKQDGINQFQHINSERWDTNDTVSFEMPGSSKNIRYQLNIQTRIDRNYHFKNLWLCVEQEYGDSITKLITDTIEMRLTDDEGNFTGKGRYLLEYLTNVREVDVYENEKAKIRIHHIMSQPVSGIHDIGIQLTPLQPISPRIDSKQDEEQDSESPQGGTTITEER